MKQRRALQSLEWQRVAALCSQQALGRGSGCAAEGKSAYETLRAPQAEFALLWGPPQLPEGTAWGKRLGESEGLKGQSWGQVTPS